MSSSVPEMKEDSRELKKKCGALIHKVRKTENGFTQERLAHELGYSVSIISKAETGAFISPDFIDKFLEKAPQVIRIDDETISSLKYYRDALLATNEETPLSSISIEVNEETGKNVYPTSQLTQQFPLPHLAPIWKFATQDQRHKILSMAILVLLVVASGLTIAWLARPAREVGGIDFNLACQAQYPGKTVQKAILLSPTNPYTWRCVIAMEGISSTILSDIDTNAACRDQYNLPSAQSAPHNSQEGNSWYCYAH
jgi:transcriptional regulator with XRE-family HTH domain